MTKMSFKVYIKKSLLLHYYYYYYICLTAFFPGQPR